MKSNFPKIALLLSSILFLLSGFLFIFFYRLLDTNNSQSKSKEEEWRIESKRRDEFKALDNSVKLVQKETEDLNTHFAKSSDVVPFLDTIEELASKAESKAEVTSVDIIDSDNTLSVGMKASGSFDNLYRFITLLENSSYELEFTSFDITKDVSFDILGNTTGSMKWNLILKVKLLSFIK